MSQTLAPPKPGAPRAVIAAKAAPPVRPEALRLVPSNRIERSVATIVVFFLAYNMPSIWALKPYGQALAGDTVVTQMALLLGAALFFGLASIQFTIAPFLELMRQEWAVPAFLLLVLASSTWSADPNNAIRHGVLMTAIMFVGYWMVVRFPLQEILGIVSAAFVAGTALQLFIIKFLPEYGATAQGWVGVFKHRNELGRHITLALLVVLVTARVHRRYRFVLFGTAAALFYMLLESNSKTSLVGFAGTAMMMVVFVLFRARRTLYGAVVVVVTSVVTATVVFAVGNVDVITSQLNRDASLTGRTDIWAAMVPQIMKRPLWGYGWDGFFTYDWRGPARPVYLLGLGEVSHAHNALLQYAASVGFVGAGLAVFFTLRLMVRGARIVRYYEGASGLFPLVFSGYLLITSVTEYGVMAPDAHLLLLVVAVGAATPGRRDALARSGALQVDSLRPGSSSRLRRHVPTTSASVFTP